MSPHGYPSVRMKRRSRTEVPSSPPVSIEGYTDLTRIGAGGFSVVYRAHEVALHRTVAVKVLNSGLTTDSDRAMFERECRALGQLNHPDIVRVYRSAFTTDDRPCIVMELYDGNLRDLLSEHGPVPAEDLLDCGVRMAVALHVAHGKQVLHRDVKPHNIFRSRYGDPALGDFGISSVIGERTHSGPAGLSLAYAAPELLEDQPVGPSTDVYALAASLHHLATGAAPFAAPDLRRAVRKILTEEPPAVDRDDLPHGFNRALRAAMAKDPEARPSSALAFAEMLREVQARGGFAQSQIKLELGHEDRRPGTPLRSTSSPTASPLPAAIGAVPAGEVSAGATIARPRSVAAPQRVAAEPARRGRAWVAVAALCASVALVVGGALLFAGDDDDAPEVSSSTLPPPPPVDTFVGSVAVPSGVQVTPAADAGSYTVDIPPVEGAVRYALTVPGGAGSVVVAAADLPHTMTFDGAACVVVQAIADSGRTSPQSAPFCAG
jgi:serine/threonine protein kinase